MNENSRKLGFGGFVAIVFGMMVGSGIFNIPQNMAVSAGPGAVLVSWVVTAVCILALVATFKTLADRRPDLDAGIYEYAQHGFGNYTGFNMAWGYWLCACFSNVAYAAMLNDSAGSFFPALLGHGWPTLLFGSALIWLMYFLVAAGIRTAKLINVVMAVLKFSSIALILALLAIHARLGTLSPGFWEGPEDAGSLWQQVKGTMMVTLWCFIGIEGAVMLASRAKNPKSVGKASVTGFLLAWVLYVLVSLLCFGIMSRARLAGLEDPSVAYVLRVAVGDWAYWFVIISIIVSLLGGWLAWSLVCAQTPMEAAAKGIFPRGFTRLNRNGMPARAMLVSSIIMEAFLCLVVTADNVYLTALSIAGMMVLPPYLFSGLYLVKASFRPKELGNPGRLRLERFRVAGILCSLACVWMIVAGGLDLLLMSSVFYLPGVFFYVRARVEGPLTLRKAAACFTPAERAILVVLAVLAVAAFIPIISC